MYTDCEDQRQLPARQWRIVLSDTANDRSYVTPANTTIRKFQALDDRCDGKPIPTVMSYFDRLVIAKSAPMSIAYCPLQNGGLESPFRFSSRISPARCSFLARNAPCYRAPGSIASASGALAGVVSRYVLSAYLTTEFDYWMSVFAFTTQITTN